MTDIIHAKKSLGQNWLINQGVLDRIVAAAELVPTDTVLEIGPGKGALTTRLAASGARIVAIEKDHRLIESLRDTCASMPNVEIIEGDILTIDIAALNLGTYKIVANLPYYITSHVIRLMLERWPSPSRAICMVQSEVADRMLAHPPDMNLLGLSVQLYATPSLVMRVSRGSFRPIPTVDSAVVQLDINEQTDRGLSTAILDIARRAFGQKRKQLKATIPESVLLEAGISATARPQELSIDQWQAIARHLH